MTHRDHKPDNAHGPDCRCHPRKPLDPVRWHRVRAVRRQLAAEGADNYVARRLGVVAERLRADVVTRRTR